MNCADLQTSDITNWSEIQKKGNFLYNDNMHKAGGEFPHVFLTPKHDYERRILWVSQLGVKRPSDPGVSVSGNMWQKPNPRHPTPRNFIIHRINVMHFCTACIKINVIKFFFFIQKLQKQETYHDCLSIDQKLPFLIYEKLTKILI